jgi:hypothetical protein
MIILYTALIHSINIIILLNRLAWTHNEFNMPRQSDSSESALDATSLEHFHSVATNFRRPLDNILKSKPAKVVKLIDNQSGVLESTSGLVIKTIFLDK